MATHSHHHGHDHDHDHDHGHDHHGHHHPAPDSGGPLVFADPAQESLNQALRSGFWVLRVLMLVMLVAYVFSGMFRVDPGEQGLISRFGKLRESDKSDGAESRFIFGPGVHWSLPDPFDLKIRLTGATQTLRVSTFCFPRAAEAIEKPLSEVVPELQKIDPAQHGSLFSGDRNLSHAEFRVEYRIANGEQFVRTIGETPDAAQPLLRRLTEDAVAGVVAGLPVERIIRRGSAGEGDDFTHAIHARLNRMLEALQAGVRVDKVTASTIEPGVVRQAFARVTDAQSDSEKAINEARQERDTQLGAAAGSRERYEALIRAIDEYGAAQTIGADPAKLDALLVEIDRQLAASDGQVARILSGAQLEARAYRDRVLQEFVAFEQLRDAYRKFPMQVALRQWVQMRERVLGSAMNDTFFIPEAGTIELITNRDEERALERLQKMLEKRAGKPGDQ